MGLPQLRIAVNLSACQLQQSDLTDMISDILREARVSPEYLEIEITESALLDAEAINPTAQKLVDMGVRLSIDDFGTGYCALAYLKQLSVNVIKIDRSFIRDIPKDQEDVAISEAIINLSKSLGLQVVAEGVESREQWEYLRRQGCDLMQGFLASRALPSDEFVLWTKTHCRQIADSHYWNFSVRTQSEDAPSRYLASVQGLRGCETMSSTRARV
jgi:EAL domain-containing protein (putative c-di-GMP-specific phosphodiesterase class I)